MLQRGTEIYPPLTPALRESCLASFSASLKAPSRFQNEIADTLRKLIPSVLEEFVTDEGYSIDLIVDWKDVRVALECDGPSHFLKGDLGRFQATGATLLKHRQLRALGWRLVSVPYWEWDEVKQQETKKLGYLLDAIQSQVDEQNAPFSPRGLCVITACTSAFAKENGKDDNYGHKFTLSKLQKSGLRTISSLANASDDQWPMDKKGKMLLPPRLMKMIRDGAVDEMSVVVV